MNGNMAECYERRSGLIPCTNHTASFCMPCCLLQNLKGKKMKQIIRNLILTAAFEFFAIAVLPAQSDWSVISTGINLNSVHAANILTAWTVGDSGTILATIDGGTNWICVNSGTSVSLKSVYFVNDMTGWIAGSGGLILKSVDGGDSWIPLTTGTSSNLEAVYFPTSDTGYAAGPSVTLKTTNGGVSWSSLVSVSGNSLFFTSANVGMATNPSGTLSRTTNGGTTWFTNVMLYPASRYAISFANSITGWVSGASTSISKTTDGGDNWISQPTGLSGFPILYGINFVSSSTGFTAGTGGIILKTTNGGSNWTTLASGTVNNLRSISLADDLHGWAVGERGTLLHTSNGGLNWITQLHQYSSPFNQGYSLSDVEMRNTATGWTSGFGGVVNKTTDGGSTWTSYSTASFNWLYSLDFINSSDTGYVCGRLGTLQRSSNGGANWSLFASGTSQHLNGIEANKFTGDTLETVMCVGNGGTILTSLNSGTSWSVSTVGGSDFNCLFVFDDLDAIVAGAGGTMYKTTDFGSNWSALSAGTTADIRAIFFSNSSTGYLCGTGGMIKKTTDGGTSWFSLMSGVSSNLTSICFEDIDYENGYCVGENGVILTTSDFGATWNRESSGSSNALTAIHAMSNYDGPGGPTVRVSGTFAKVLRRIAPVALPVELSAFTSAVSGSDVILYWLTSQELNNRGFEIQRMKDDEWRTAGFVEGHGTTGTLSEYQYTDKDLQPGSYRYRLKQTDLNGHYRYFELGHEVPVSLPEKFMLEQNYPNPFNPATTLAFELPVRTHVSLTVYDISGRQVSKIADGTMNSGRHVVRFIASDLTSGTYLAVMKAGTRWECIKMVLIR